MHQAMINEIAEAMIADRRREGARQRRIAAARCQRRSAPIPVWRVRLGRALVTAGSSIGGGRAAPRNIGGA
jgi:hypothetical protein